MSSNWGKLPLIDFAKMKRERDAAKAKAKTSEEKGKEASHQVDKSQHSKQDLTIDEVTNKMKEAFKKKS